MRLGARLLAAVLLVAFGTACNERLTAPVECPASCPGGQAEVFDTVVTPISGLDSSFVGFLPQGAGTSLLASNGLPAADARAVIRFTPRPATVRVGETDVGYTVDSVALSTVVVARDTTVHGLTVLFYRLPASVDSTVTFDAVEAALTAENLLGSVPVPDGVPFDTVRLVLRGPEAGRVAIPDVDNGMLAIAVSIQAPAPTGIRIASGGAGSGAPQFLSYVTAMTPDAVKPSPLATDVAFNTFLVRDPVVLDPNLLVVGGAPAARALIRFDVPPRILDSATIIRATLELIPAAPILGLPGDSVVLEARAVLADLGAKSPVNRDPARPATPVTIFPAAGDTVRLEITPIVRAFWQADAVPFPSAVFLSLRQPEGQLPGQEGSRFTVPVFGSTRSAMGQPRLRITYSLPFPFESP